jgi:sugar phosphate isomerase/epimerase
VIRTIRTLSREYGVESFVFSGAFTDTKGARKWAAYLNELAGALEGENCRIVYHNHDQELNLVTVTGRTMTALDYFFSLVREDVLLQLDIGWAGNGADEVALAKQYANRIYSLHLKDFVPGARGMHHNPNIPKALFAPIGEGEIRTAEVLALCDTFPHFSGQIIIDQDFSPTDILQDLKVGYQNVNTMLHEGA